MSSPLNTRLYIEYHRHIIEYRMDLDMGSSTTTSQCTIWRIDSVQSRNIVEKLHVTLQQWITFKCIYIVDDMASDQCTNMEKNTATRCRQSSCYIHRFHFSHHFPSCRETCCSSLSAASQVTTNSPSHYCRRSPDISPMLFAWIGTASWKFLINIEKTH